jgi:hypothetical protein
VLVARNTSLFLWLLEQRAAVGCWSVRGSSGDAGRPTGRSGAGARSCRDGFARAAKRAADGGALIP